MWRIRYTNKDLKLTEEKLEKSNNFNTIFIESDVEAFKKYDEFKSKYLYVDIYLNNKYIMHSHDSSNFNKISGDEENIEESSCYYNPEKIISDCISKQIKKMEDLGLKMTDKERELFINGAIFGSTIIPIKLATNNSCSSVDSIYDLLNK